MRRLTIALASSLVVLSWASFAAAQDAPTTTTPATPGPNDSPTVTPAIPPSPPPPEQPTPAKVEKQFPAIGGHLGMAIPIATLGGRKNTAIGADFFTLGLTPGITVHLDEQWAIDFEFIALSEMKNTPAATTFVVDPGVIRKFESLTLGLRFRSEVGAPTNFGLVPIVVVPFKISHRLVYFVEGDIPLFIYDAGDKALFNAVFLFQTGVGF